MAAIVDSVLTVQNSTQRTGRGPPGPLSRYRIGVNQGVLAFGATRSRTLSAVFRPPPASFPARSSTQAVPAHDPAGDSGQPVDSIDDRLTGPSTSAATGTPTRTGLEGETGCTDSAAAQHTPLLFSAGEDGGFLEKCPCADTEAGVASCGSIPGRASSTAIDITHDEQDRGQRPFQGREGGDEPCQRHMGHFAAAGGALDGEEGGCSPRYRCPRQRRAGVDGLRYRR